MRRCDPAEAVSAPHLRAWSLIKLRANRDLENLGAPSPVASTRHPLPGGEGLRVEPRDLSARRFREVTEATLLGTALTAVLQGFVVALGFATTRLSDPWFWGAITAFVSVLPVFGSALVWIPGVLTLAIEGRYGAATGLFALGVIVASNIDNVMRPLVNRRVSNLHPMTTLVGAFAGVGVLGLPGILLGPLAITYFFELVALYREEYGTVTPAAESSPRPSQLVPR